MYVPLLLQMASNALTCDDVRSVCNGEARCSQVFAYGKTPTFNVRVCKGSGLVFRIDLANKGLDSIFLNNSFP